MSPGTSSHRLGRSPWVQNPVNKKTCEHSEPHKPSETSERSNNSGGSKNSENNDPGFNNILTYHEITW